MAVSGASLTGAVHTVLARLTLLSAPAVVSASHDLGLRLRLRNLLVLTRLSVGSGVVSALDLVGGLRLRRRQLKVERSKRRETIGRRRQRRHTGLLRLRGSQSHRAVRAGERSGQTGVRHADRVDSKGRQAALRDERLTLTKGRRLLRGLLLSGVEKSVGDLAESIFVKRARVAASGTWLLLVDVVVLVLVDFLLLVAPLVLRHALSAPGKLLGHLSDDVAPMSLRDLVRGFEGSHILLDVLKAKAVLLAGARAPGTLGGDGLALTILLRARRERSELDHLACLPLDFVTHAQGLLRA